MALSVTKSIGESYTSLPQGQIIDYFIEVANDSASITATDIVMTDAYSNYLIFSENSVQINNEKVLWGANPRNGVNIGSVAPSSTVLVSFQAQCMTTTPVGATVSNQALVSYAGVTVASNPIALAVTANNLALRKSSDKTLAVVGDIVSYSVLVENLSNSELSGLSIGDNIVPISGTVKLNGVSVTTSGIDGAIYIPSVTIAANDYVVIDYQVKVVPGYQAIGYIDNGAEVSYNDNGSTVAQPSNNVYVQVPPLGRGVLFID